MVSVYEEDNTTQITAGVSLSVDYDSVTGLNQATIVATAANGYETGKSYDLVVTTGTVDSVSVVGEIVFSFTINASAAFTKVSSIGSGAAGAVNFEPTEDNTSGAIIDGVTSVGTPTGTFANASAEDGTVHSIADVTNDIDWVYGYDIGGSRAATEVSLLVNVNGNTDEMKVKAYDHIGEGWDIVGTIDGSGGSTFISLNLALLSKHTGTGGELGKVYIRFDTDSTTPALLEIDKALVAAVSTSTSVGYAGGQYWVSSTGTAGNEIGTNGTADNPCPWANALVMNAIQPLNRFHVANGNSITLSANSDNYTLTGSNWNLALGGQSIEGIAVLGTATITGVGTATTTPPTFIDCNFGACTIPPSELRECGIGNGSGTFTAGSAGQYLLDNCFSEVPGSGSPVLDFSGVGATTGINNRRWAGGATYTLTSDCTLSHEVLAGGGTTITTGGGDVEVRGIPRSLTVTVSASEKVQFVGIVGPITITDNASVAPEINLYGVCSSLTDGTGSANDYTVSNSSVNAEVDTALSDYDGPTNAQLDARTLLAASYFDPAADTVATVTTVTNMGGTDSANTVVPMTAALSQTEHDATQAAVSGLNDPTAAEIVDEWETQSQADPTGFNVNVLEVNGTAQTANDNGADINELQTNQGNWLTATGFSTHSAADVWAVVTRVLTANTNLNDPTANAIADQVWEELIADHSGTSGSTAEALAAAGGAGDPWITALPGSYTGSQAGKMLSDVLGDTGTTLPAQISALNDFDPATDTVANVTTVGTTTTTTDMRGTDGANTTVPLAAAASQTEHDATQATLGGLNDVAATDIVSNGAITTLAGAVVNVDTVDVTTTNADMVGTDNAATEAKQDIIDANVDAIPALIAALNDLSTTDIETITIETGYTLKEALQLIGAAVAGKLSGAATTTNTIRSLDDSADRITATVDTDGNRSAVTHNV
ncbi:MAG: hypothetical protein GY938_12715 [Ketobacter sp.]|nr:hypothetical protein [Ketobacter sp.]